MDTPPKQWCAVCRRLLYCACRTALTESCWQIPGHNLSHHRHTETRKDPMRTSKVQYKWHLLNLLLFQPTVALDVFRMDLSYTLLQRAMKTPFFAHVCMEWGVLILSQLFLSFLDWRRFMLYIYAPHLFAQWGIVTMNILQHDGCHVSSPDDKTTNYNTARNFTGHTVNLLTFNNGFHTIHHMYPTMHWSDLAREHRARVQPHIHPNLDQSCMCSYVYSTFVYPGRRVDYLGNPVVFQHTPDLPDEDWIHEEHAPDGMSRAQYALKRNAS